MADPLSISTGIITLLATSIKVGVELREFYEGATLADAAVRSLLTDVEGLTRVLQSMKDTVDRPNVQQSLQATGHIGNHWRNIEKSVRDGTKTLEQLQTTLEKVNKDVSVLNGARKHVRLKLASGEISMFQHEIRSYTDTLQLSLQTVILWNQVTFQESTDQLLPSLGKMNIAIRRIAVDLNNRMGNLHNLVQSTFEQNQFNALNNLRNCVQSAATIVSSASTILSGGTPRNDQDTFSSEYGDIFPPETSFTMLRWISSKSVLSGEPASRASLAQTEHIGNDMRADPADDSDDDLEMEIIQGLLQRGKQKLASNDYERAERLFKNCLKRIPLRDTSSGLTQELNEYLFQAYYKQAKWHDAKSILLQRLASSSESTTRDSPSTLDITLSLADVLYFKGDFSEARLYGRRALKGYRKLGDEGTDGVEKSLNTLILIFKGDDDPQEEEAYEIVLSNLLEQKALRQFSFRHSTVNSALLPQNNQSQEALNLLKDEEGFDAGELVPSENSLSRNDSGTAVGSDDHFENSIIPQLEATEIHGDNELTDTAVASPRSFPGEKLLGMVPIRPAPAIGSLKSISETDLRQSPHPQLSSETNIPSLVPGQSHDPKSLGRAVSENINKKPKRAPGHSRHKSLPSGSKPLRNRKLVIVGDCVGKTCLLSRYSKGLFPEDFIPTVFESYVMENLSVGGKPFEISLWDTPGLEDYDRLRPLSYIDASIFMLCFGIDSPSSFDNIKTKWIPELRHFAEKKPIILVGLKRDLRSDTKTIEELAKTSQSPITAEQGETLCRAIGASKYVECSARTGEGVHEVFEAALIAAVAYGKQQRRKISLSFSSLLGR